MNGIGRKMLFMAVSMMSVHAVHAQYYDVDEGWIVAVNSERYNNRPLYLNNSDAFILTGDRPLARFAKGDNLYGTMSFRYCSDEGWEIPLDSMDNVRSMYRCGQMRWEFSDKRVKGRIILEIVPVVKDYAAVVKFTAEGDFRNGSIKWYGGGDRKYKGEHLSWRFDAMGHPDILEWNDLPKYEDCVAGELKLKKTACIHVKMNSSGKLDFLQSDNRMYNETVERLSDIRNRMVIDTPDEFLNVIAEASAYSVDGTWYPPIFVHGCMQWNSAFPGWRTLFGGTMYGWHERVREQARYYIDSQVKQSDKLYAKADTALLMTGQHQDSRFYGRGRIMRDQSFYDMQSQFFDQLVEEYRWTADKEFSMMLRPALELHLEWMQDCFDPDGDGLYESYINAWPTDSQWYNGGGTAEETSYAYRGHKAALDMALADGDTLVAEKHRNALKRIKNGFMKYLWLKDRGHSGAYKEQGGYGRVHDNPWLYSIFLPIDAGLVDEMQMIESLYYPEWALQNDTLPAGGKMVWTSNWIPGIWSVRELWPGDNYHLALAYFKAGLSKEGWDILKGTFMRSAFNHTVPGNLGSEQGGIDFGDCVHTFTRTLVSGLFGYWPDYPNGMVRIAPSFPGEWKHASMRIPDYALSYADDGGKAKYTVKLAKEARIELRLPVQCGRITGVFLNRRRTDGFRCIPAPGRSLVEIVSDSPLKKAEVVIEYEDEQPYHTTEYIDCVVGDSLTWSAGGCDVLAVYDPQEMLDRVELGGDKARLFVSRKSGNHTLVAKVRCDSHEQYRVLRMDVKDPDAEKLEKWKNLIGENLQGDWHFVDIKNKLNADVTKIFKQKYLSPRPNTVSLRIGTDGYSPWTFPYWRTPVPEIKLDSVGCILSGDSLLTPSGVRFRWYGGEDNVAFVSLWDNYPDSLTFPVGGACGEAISLLVCGSTNVMQCGVENAVIYINYEDGSRDRISLVPPVNYWNLSKIDSHATGPRQESRTYYTSPVDRFCVPEVLPNRVSLGENCTAMVLSRRLRPGVGVSGVTVECLSQEVVVGIMGISIGEIGGK